MAFTDNMIHQSHDPRIVHASIASGTFAPDSYITTVYFSLVVGSWFRVAEIRVFPTIDVRLMCVLGRQSKPA